MSQSKTSNEPPHRYDSQLAGQLELAWQDRWEAEGTFNSPNPVGPLSEGFESMEGRRKFYVLDMFPYPSGSGLHVGHPLGYIGTDVYARYLRMTGHHVVHTFGYDAFGLPAEQYAINTGQHPAVTTQQNIDNMRRQLRRLGLGHDTRRELATTDVSFYRWTQWIFLRLFNSWYDAAARQARSIDELIAEYSAGQRETPGRSWHDLSRRERRELVDSQRLAYVSEELVNWCPGLGTVVANEEVTSEGRSDIGNYPVYRRPLRQWMLRITAYAERLIDDLDLVDWPESIKLMQRNWIGANDGANIDLPVVGSPQTIRVFSTRPDTLPGATYVVIAPEHPLLDTLVADSWPDGTPEAWRYPAGRPDEATTWEPQHAVAAYQERASRLSERKRTTEADDKTGVFTGSYAVNLTTGQPIPVFVADYVLMGYGTGAVMAVPAHDQRDFDFAHELGLDITAVIQPPVAWFDGYAVPDTAAEWPEAFAGEGPYLPHPGPTLAGLSKSEAITATIAWLSDRGAGEKVRAYKLRDWQFSRQRYWGEPFPIVYDEEGLPLALPDELLPVQLPEIVDFRPTPTDDESSEPLQPLARAGDWASVNLDLGDGPRTYRRELNTMPQWAGSCWYYLRYLDPTNDKAFIDPSIERYWMVPDDVKEPGDGGVDLYVGGVEHAVLHLLYARFWHKVLFDLGYVSSKEPFRRLYNQGYVLADAFIDERGMYVPAADVAEHGDGSLSYEGELVTRRAGKMGKSLKNSVSPDDMYDSYGADSLRLYEMAMGPLDTDRPWRTHDIIGVHRFLQRLWRSMIDEASGRPTISAADLDADTAQRLHQTIKTVRAHYDNLRFNTAVARLMELTNHATKVSAETGALPRALAEPLVLMVAPLAPHIAEELWSRLGHLDSLAYAPFPEADERLAAVETVTLPVQIGGKTRFTLDVPVDADKTTIEQVLRGSAGFAEHTAGLTLRRLVIVPGRIINIVTG
ncbi:leucine--tRNA ligase [Kribbella sp. NPDC055071]